MRNNNGTNKFVILLIVLVALVGSGIAYRKFFLPDAQKPMDTGVVREITVRIPKNTWTFDPESIDANRGDTLKMTFVNEDDYDHGVGIDAYGVSQRIPARTTLAIAPFVVTKGGDFQFYCSVSCSEGVAESGTHKDEHRGHFDQIGVLHVREAGSGSETPVAKPTLPTIHIPAGIVRAQETFAQEQGISADLVKTVYKGSKVWMDSCLDLPKASSSAMCTKTNTPGYEIVLRVNGKDSGFRINDDGSLMRSVPVLSINPK